MPEFAFVARDLQGRTRRGTREASSEASLLERLRADGLFALEVQTGARAADGPASASRNPLFRWMSPRPLDVELGLRQLATMGKSGVPLLACYPHELLERVLDFAGFAGTEPRLTIAALEQAWNSMTSGSVPASCPVAGIDQ